MSSQCNLGLQVFIDWAVPESIVHRQPCMGRWYQKHPVMSRTVVTPLALFSGIVKVFLFPVICLIGGIAMPIIALVKTVTGSKNGSAWLLAWGFCVLGIAASITFLAVTCFYLPLVASSVLLIALLATSIVLHVYLLVKEPPNVPQLS